MASRARKSTGPARHRARSNQVRTHPHRKASKPQHEAGKPGREPEPGPTRVISDVLESFDEAFTLVATAASAIEAALDSTVIEDCAETADKVECLVRGVRGLRRARIEIADALYQGQVGLQ